MVYEQRLHIKADGKEAFPDGTAAAGNGLWIFRTAFAEIAAYVRELAAPVHVEGSVMRTQKDVGRAGLKCAGQRILITEAAELYRQ